MLDFVFTMVYNEGTLVFSVPCSCVLINLLCSNGNCSEKTSR